MNAVQRETLDVLLQTLLDKGLISRMVYDKSREKILGTFDFPSVTCHETKNHVRKRCRVF